MSISTFSCLFLCRWHHAGECVSIQMLASTGVPVTTESVPSTRFVLHRPYPRVGKAFGLALGNEKNPISIISVIIMLKG